MFNIKRRMRTNLIAMILQLMHREVLMLIINVNNLMMEAVIFHSFQIRGLRR
jgi:hypothetical protein